MTVYVFDRRRRFDPDQQLELSGGLNVAYPSSLEGAMRKAVSRAAVRPAGNDMQNFVAWWATAMWCGALVFLLATFHPY
jgi:hypothetical protein